MNKFFYILHVQLSMSGCCFRGLGRVVTIYAYHSSNYDWVHGI